MMSDVRSSLRTLKLFEAFATHKKPMTLSELAATLSTPPSSCLLIIRTLISRGYLYDSGRNQTYYPTGRMLEIVKEIARHDSPVERVMPFLEQLRDLTQETVALAKRQGQKLVYLAIAESSQTIRVNIPVGTIRPLHSTATGKALLGGLPDTKLRQLVAQLDLAPLTQKTVVDADVLVQEIMTSRKRGYFTNSGGGVPDLSSISVTLGINGDIYALSVMAPSYRFDSISSNVGARVVEFVKNIEQEMALPNLSTKS